MSNQTQTPAGAAAPPARSRWAGGAPPFPGARPAALGTLATVVSLVILVALGEATGHLLMIAPLAATAMIICSTPVLPPAQPRGVILGQLGSGILGLVAVALFGHSLWVAAVAAGLSVAVMLLLRAVHAPAAATAVLAVLQDPAPVRFLVLLAVGSVLLVLVGLIASRLGVIGKYPAYWW
ncbi:MULTISPECIES: HPP family protein [unclassified Streptomyces]|uniref:HPP family protein n=1 Tax=unclassified Streptomyces TaxID=2593676 RepID=UPI000F799241|nr:HPP family protein [Streptomyces sp. WAC01280]RSS59749.1 HPP family protein [Streptomyces sp. WAC01280]